MKKFIIKSSIIIISSIALILLYSRFIGTSGLKVKEYKIVNDKIITEYHGLKIVHISDIHYGSTINEKKLKHIVEEVNLINPDIVVFTGDLIDERYEYNSDEIINNLSNIKAKLGKYAINGNHDTPIEKFNEIIDKSGFINLNNKYELIYNNSNEPIVISGIDSNIINKTDLKEKTKSFNEFISNQQKEIYSILLIHEADFVDNLNLDNYDLILAGHSHGGQFNVPLLKNLYLPEGANKYLDRYYKLNNTDLYISNGIGTSIFKFRLFSKPSISFYRIANK